jgi:CubicO group peptidase (beta-lactamase class C family)
MPSDHRFARSQRVIDAAVAARAFPCAVVEIGRAAAPLWSYAAGRLTYAPDATAARISTVFDLASLTKVLATATIALVQVSRGQLSLDALLANHFAQWSGQDREQVTVRDLLEHCSGLPSHRRYFEALNGRGAYQAAICREPLAYPPRTQSLYSDPGFMLLGFLLEDAGGAPLDQQFVEWRTRAGSEDPLTFNPPPAWRENTAPTEEDPWRGKILAGEVHDENAAALGGVAAHAGLFGTAAATGACARWWLSLLNGTDDPGTGISASLAATFAQRSTVPGSSRASGWDTMLTTSSCGTCLSSRAIGHTGFTGTSLWLDPEQDLYVVLLSNRVHPTRNNDAMQPVRRAFHDAVVADLREMT